MKLKTLKAGLKKTILFFFWGGKNSAHKVFTENGYLAKKLRHIPLTKKTYHILFAPIITQQYSSQETDLLRHEASKFLQNQYPKLQESAKKAALRLIYDMRLEDAGFIDLVFTLAENTESAELRYWLTQSIDFIVFARSLELSHNFFTRRQRLFVTICQENNIHIGSHTHLPQTGAKKKICIITYLMDSTEKNSAQRVLMMFANNINHDVFDISVVCLDAFSCTQDSIANFTSWENSYKKRAAIQQLLPPETAIFYCSAKNIQAKLQSCMDFIRDISPDIILDISDEYSPVSYLYSKDYTTIYSPLRRKVSASFCTYYRSSEAEETKLQSKYYDNIMASTHILEWVFPEYVMQTGGVHTREAHRLSPQDFILISVGNLPPQDYSFYDRMVDVLRSDGSYVWLLVGCEVPQYLTQQAGDLFNAQKIIDWGYEPELDSLYRICNAFVSPDKTGGSGAIAIAAQQGLPLVITDYPSDARRWIKKENCLHDGYESYKSEIERLRIDANYYSTQAKKYKALVAAVSDKERMWNDFNELLLEALDGTSQGHTVIDSPKV